MSLVKFAILYCIEPCKEINFRISRYHLLLLLHDSRQYSVTKHEKQISLLAGDSGLPGVFFMYEFSPMMVKVSERSKSFLHFLTSLCAIVGGVFTVAGLLDAFLYHSAKYLQKNELGKLG